MAARAWERGDRGGVDARRGGAFTALGVVRDMDTRDDNTVESLADPLGSVYIVHEYDDGS